MSSEIDLGDEVITEYADDSDYVSSEEHYTPFPSLTMSKKIELEKYIHNGQVTYNISTFSERLASQDLRSLSSEPDIPERVTPSPLRTSSEQNEQQTEQQQQDVSKQYENNGCCLLL